MKVLKLFCLFTDNEYTYDRVIGSICLYILGGGIPAILTVGFEGVEDTFR